MEPLFFKAENVVAINELADKQDASMEPLFFKAENAFASLRLAPLPVLQWSRFFSKRKISQRERCFQGQRLASMEPLFFKAENRGSACSHPPA